MYKIVSQIRQKILCCYFFLFGYAYTHGKVTHGRKRSRETFQSRPNLSFSPSLSDTLWSSPIFQIFTVAHWEGYMMDLWTTATTLHTAHAVTSCLWWFMVTHFSRSFYVGERSAHVLCYNLHYTLRSQPNIDRVFCNNPTPS